jgi:hypothetical protein
LLVCIKDTTKVICKETALRAQLALNRRLDIGDSDITKPIEKLAKLLGRRQLSSVKGSSNGRSSVHDEDTEEEVKGRRAEGMSGIYSGAG